MSSSRRPQFKSWFLSVALLSCFLILSAPVRGQNLEKAIREGEVVWYTLMAVEDSQKIAQAFEKKYPGVKVKVFRNRETALLPRIISEKQSGRTLADITSLRGAGYYQLRKRNLIQPYISSEAKNFPKGFRDAKGYWTDLYDTYYVWSYNTALVKEPPRSYDEIVRASYRGRIGMDDEEVEWFAGLAEYWGRERASNFLKNLAAQQPRFRDGHTLVAQLMAAGEFEIALVFVESVERMKKSGAPVEWVKTFDPIIASVHPIAIAADAPHPEAARLFVDFALSKEAQSIVRSSGRISPRSDMQPEQARLKLHPVQPEAAADYEGLQKEWREIFKQP